MVKISVIKNEIYIKSNNRPSFFVINLSVFITIKKNKAAIMVNILAVRNGAMSLISNGQIIAIIPKINVVQITTEPIIFPKTSQPSPRLAEIIPKYVSGKQFPKETIKIPTSEREMPKFLAKY